MTYRVYPTDVVNEPFADDRGFPGNRNYIDTLAGYSGIRAPTQQEFNAIFYSLDRGYRDGLFGEVDINSRSYTVHTFVFDGGSTTSISDGSLAFNAGANAIAAGAPANSIWIGFNANYLTPESSFGDLVLYGSHEVNHSSINIDRRSSQILNDIPNDLLANIAAKLGLSLDRRFGYCRAKES